MTEDISRDEVIERVKRGQMTPDQAEAWSAKKGTEPFAEERTLQHYNPIKDPDWSLPMVVAWIIWQTPADVMKVVPSRGKQCKIWHPETVGPSKLPPPKLPSLEEQNSTRQTLPQTLYVLEVPEDLPVTALLINAAERVTDEEKSRWQVAPVEVNEMLHAKLKEGQLKATGVKDKTNRVIILPEEWQDLSTFNLNKDPRAVFGPGSEHPRYIKVSVRRDDVLAIWPVKGFFAKTQDNLPPAGKKKGLDEDELRLFVESFIQEKIDQRSTPYLKHLLRRAIEKGYVGAREICTYRFREIMGPTTPSKGRPKASVEK